MIPDSVFAELVSDSSGKLGDTIYSRNPYGPYTRPYASVTDPATAPQLFVRQIFKDACDAWPNLSAANRARWRAYASRVPFRKRLLQAYFLTGYNMFIRSNVPRFFFGRTIVSVPPKDFNLPEFRLPTITVPTGTGFPIATFTFPEQAWLHVPGAICEIATGPPQPPSVHFYATPFAFFGFIEGNVATPPYGPTTRTTGYFAAPGDRVFFRFRLTLPDGRLSSIFRASVIAT